MVNGGIRKKSPNPCSLRNLVYRWWFPEQTAAEERWTKHPHPESCWPPAFKIRSYLLAYACNWNLNYKGRNTSYLSLLHLCKRQNTANSIVTSAKENARKMDEDARKLANQVVDDANSKASTIVKSADEKALKIVNDAETRS